MLIGAMNHPGRDVFAEIDWMTRLGLEFIDLTLEPPRAATWCVDAPGIRKMLEDRALGVVGHTAYYLPFCSPFESLRRAAVEEARRAIELFGIIGAKWVNLHPDRHAPFCDRSFVIERNLQTLDELLPVARSCGVGLMLENLPGSFNTAAQLAEFFARRPELGLHLDIGHSNLMVEQNTVGEILAAHGSRLRHVHLHDNKGGTADLHLPLGTGTLALGDAIRLLKRSGYDGTITLEVFAPDPQYLAYSRLVLRRLWNETLEP